MNVLVLGSAGMLGLAVKSYFASKGHDVTVLTRKEFDIAADDFANFASIFATAKPDTVINCAGVIKPRIQAMSVEAVMKVNAIFPVNLAKLCKTMSVPCFHIATDCVYSGRKGGYTEDDLFDAEDFYGMSKNAGDSADCMVLRSSIIGEERGQARSLFEWARGEKGKEVKGFTNHRWNGVTTVYLAELIEQILLEKRYAPGLFHLHSPEPVSKLQLLQIFNEVYGLELKIEAAQGPTACDRSLGSKRRLSPEIATRSIAQQVQEMRTFFATIP